MHHPPQAGPAQGGTGTVREAAAHPLPAPGINTTPGGARRRRRLWELPTQAHELLLALSFTPATLRREAARTLGQMHQGQCVLRGSDVDVLYSVIHDMDKRNPLSEAVQRKLDARHALALKRLAPLRAPQALQTAWQQALQGDDMPGTLWALLTHTLGTALEAPALFDARGWVFAHTRRSLALAQAQNQAHDALCLAREQADDLRLRLAGQQQQAEAELAQARQELARLSGELSHWRQAHAALAQAAPAPQPDSEVPSASAQAVAAAPTALPLAAAAPRPALAEHVTSAATPSFRPIAMHGRHVLCVGGIRHAVSRYRSRIEGLGGHFEHHDGGVEDGVQTLDGRLQRADVVICQAACINHAAYHRIKRHCERTGTPCVYLERPSLSRFDRALHELGATAP